MTKKTDFDHYADEYNSLLKEQLSFFSSDNNYFAEYKVLQLKQILKTQPKTILDFGCGIGRSSFYLKQHFPNAQIYGCDLSEKSLSAASAAMPEGCFLSMSEIEKASFTFDLIFIAGVFHHIEPNQRPSTLKLIAQLSKNGTHVVAFEHNPFNPVTRHLVNTCPFDEDAVLLKPGELKNLFRLAGLKNITCHYTLFFPSSLKWLRFLEKYLRFLPIGGQYLVSGIV